MALTMKQVLRRDGVLFIVLGVLAITGAFTIPG